MLLLLALLPLIIRASAGSDQPLLRRNAEIRRAISRRGAVRDGSARGSGPLAALDHLDAFLELEALHSAHHATALPASWVLGGDFGCTFRTYWDSILTTCHDGSLMREVQKLTPAAGGGIPADQVDSFCKELESA